MANYSRSLDWEFPVDSGFNYLLRFHFCEIQLEVTEQNQRVFTISINNQTAEIAADVIFWTGGNEIPIFRDYITWVPNDGRRGKGSIRLSLFPNNEGRPLYSNALLNGLEIFKLGDSSRSPAAANPDPEANSSPPAVAVNPGKNNKSGGSSIIYAVVGSVIGILAVAAAVSFLIFRRRRKVNDSDNTSAAAKSSWVPLSTASKSTTRTSGSGVSLPSDLCRHFLLDEIKAATGNFDDNFVIGKGGFGNVYRGFIDDGATAVAIKRLNPSSNQGAHEFLTEIEMLSKLRHLHLVSLIGYCDDLGEMILVYDYMARGTLRDNLCNSTNPPLTWTQRLQICIGAARGLHHLHDGATHRVVHTDVKSSNILLDNNWVAKISDFGLSKMGPENDSFTHISTNVKGTFGYLDPHYYSTQSLTTKSDVYAFGVVLFEVLSARPAVDRRLVEEEEQHGHGLAGWARHCISEGGVDRVIDPNMMGQISAACLKVFVEIGGRCLHTKPYGRPAMADVVMGLELAINLQRTADPIADDERINGEDDVIPKINLKSIDL